MKSSSPSRIASALLPASRPDLCLDFANTRYWRGTETPVEQLNQPDEFVAWCAAQATVDAAALKPIALEWRAHPRKASAALVEGLSLREAIYRIFSSAAARGQPDSADLALLNTALARAPARTHLHRADDGYRWRIEGVAPAAASLLAPVLWSAGDLLAGARLERVRRCANEQCLWLFLDSSRSGARRWCSMSSCGNRAKAHRHYLKFRHD
jgi:predicted RNA-binding Zn ribbon-like protein